MLKINPFVTFALLQGLFHFNKKVIINSSKLKEQSKTDNQGRSQGAISPLPIISSTSVNVEIYVYLKPEGRNRELFIAINNLSFTAVDIDY